MCVFVSLTCLVAPVTLLAPLPLHFQPLLNASAWPPRAEALRLDARAISGPPAALEPIDRLPFPLTLIGWFNRGYPSRRRSTETVTGRWIDGGRGARALPSRPVPSRLFLLARHFLIEPLPCCHVGHLDCDWDLIPFISSWLKLSFIDLFIFFIYIYIYKKRLYYLFIYLFIPIFSISLFVVVAGFVPVGCLQFICEIASPSLFPLAPPPFATFATYFVSGSIFLSISQFNKMKIKWRWIQEPSRSWSILIRIDLTAPQIKSSCVLHLERRGERSLKSNLDHQKKKDPSKEE